MVVLVVDEKNGGRRKNCFPSACQGLGREVVLFGLPCAEASALSFCDDALRLSLRLRSLSFPDLGHHLHEPSLLHVFAHALDACGGTTGMALCLPRVHCEQHSFGLSSHFDSKQTWVACYKVDHSCIASPVLFFFTFCASLFMRHYGFHTALARHKL